MILTCPACASRYVVDDARVGPAGRTVRCSHCGAVWRAEAGQGAGPAVAQPIETLTNQAKAADLPGEALPRQFRARVEEQKRARRTAAAGAVWGGMAVVIVGLLVLALMFRNDVARIWPKTASAYAAVGLPVNAVGLAVENITSSPGIEEGREVLVVGGDVRNVTRRSQPLPQAIRLQLLAKDGRVLATGRVRLRDAALRPDEARPFTYRFVDPPSQAASLRSDFIPRGPGDQAPSAAAMAGLRPTPAADAAR